MGNIINIQILFQNVFIIGVDENSVKLETIVAFFTGADAVPPLGYPSVTLNFNDENIYPTASTCAIVLTLPTKHQTYDVFKQHMMIGFSMHGGFGLM